MLVVSDYDPRGSGYSRIVRTLFPGVVGRGHEVVVLGVSYDGAEHSMPLTVIPSNFKMGRLQMAEIANDWRPDYFVVALDLTYGADLLEEFAKGPKYVGIFPIESDPLLAPSEWHDSIKKMHKAFLISPFGQRCCEDAGLTTTTYLPVPIDRSMWRPWGDEEKKRLKAKLGLEDSFVVLTVMDNQERKNLPAAVEAFSRFNADHPEADAFYILVTKRRPTELGWRVPQLLSRFGVQARTLLQEVDLTVGGIPVPDETLAEFYGAADAYLHTSQAEGLGLTILEAMSCRVPVVATDCTSMTYHLAEGRGLPARVEYSHIGSFMNGNRYFVDPRHAAEQLGRLYTDPDLRADMIDKAERYVAEMTTELAVDVFLKGLGE